MYICSVIIRVGECVSLFSGHFLCLQRYYILRLSNPVWSVNAPTAYSVMTNGKWIAVFLS